MKFKVSAMMLVLLMCWTALSLAQPTRAMGMCLGVNYHKPQDSKYEGYSPLSVSYLGGLGYAEQYWALKDLPDFVKPENIRVLHQPKHGKVIFEAYPANSNPGNNYGDYRYIPNRGYLGDDKVTFKLNVDGKIFKILYVLKVIKQDNTGADIPPDTCDYLHRGDAWKISSNSPDDTPAFTSPRRLG